MIHSVSSVVTPRSGGDSTAPAAHASATGASTSGKGLREVAAQFETLMVHELLSAAKIGGDGGGGGYAGMATDALAAGISKAGGLGLAHQLEEALSARR